MEKGVKLALVLSFLALLAVVPLLLFLLAKSTLFFKLALVLGIGFLLAFLLGLVILARSLLTARPLILKPLALWSFEILFFVALKLGSLLRLSEEAVARAYLTLNNRLVALEKLVLEPEELLLVIPHCLQWSGCPYKLDLSTEGCRECGRCQVGALRKLAQSYGVALAFATGGTLARRAIENYRPRSVIAVACEGDLWRGTTQLRGKPVYGVLNQRPQGPCADTCVPLEEIKKALELFLKLEV